MKINFKRHISIFLVILMILTSFGVFPSYAALSYGGECGENLTWSFNDETGELIISGSGEMDDYAIMYIPWHNFRTEIKSVKIEESVTSVCDYAFFNCQSLTDIEISKSIEIIGNLAFAQCYALESISVDSQNAFYFSDNSGVLYNKNQSALIQYPSASSQTEYILPDSVETIYEDAFRYAENLTEITLSSSLKTIGEEAFYGSTINSIDIPSSVEIIGKDAFGWCPSLTEINVSNENNVYSSDSNGVLFNKNKTELIKFPNKNAETDYTIPDGVTTLADNSFENCYSLQSVTIPSSVTAIGSGVFFNCSLKSIYVDSTNQNYSSDENGVLFTKDKSELIVYPSRNAKKGYNIPDSVSTISEFAFYNNQIIESISLPDSVTTIENGAFSLCTNLEYIHFGNNIKTIGTDIVSDGNTYFCAETDDCIAKEYADANGIEFIVCDGHDINGITVSDYEITIENKQNYQLTATVTPDTATDKSVVWSSDNEAVVSVNENGKITASLPGTAVVTASTSDGKYSAKCNVTVNPRYFNVVWNVDGEKTTVSIAEGTEITSPDAPSKTGYTFAGWSPEVPDTMPAKNIELTAKWTVNSYNAVFYSNGGKWSDGSTEKTYSVKYGSQIYSPRTPSKEGYIFVGWSDELGTMDNVNGKEFYAVWEASDNTPYIVETYVMNIDGTYTVTEDVLAGTTDTTVNAAYSIDNGFVLNTDNSVLSGVVAADGSLVLKVYIDREIFEIILNGEKLECLYGTEITEPVKPAAPEGHLQEGWIDENGDEVVFPIIADENFPTEIKPNFVRQSYTVTWIVDDSQTKESYLFEEKITLPSEPSKTGYTFIGWTPEVEDTMPSTNLTYTAVWSVNSYDAVFDASSGVWTDGSTKKTIVTNYDAPIIAPENPVKAGYIFAGWSPEVGVMNDINGKNFTANWIASTDTVYTVEIYTMTTDGSYSKVTQKLTGATDSTVVADYTVDTGFVLNEEKSVLSGVVKADNSLILKAYIDRKSYKLITVSDGVATTTEYLFGASIVEPAAPVKEEYDFVGWDKDIPSTMPAEDITLTAQFTKTIYTCTDCNEKFEDKSEYNNHLAFEQSKKDIRVSIKNKVASRTINYGETLRLTAVTSATLPAGTKICWYVDGAKVYEGETFEISFESGTKTVTVKITESNDTPLKDSNGNEISDSQNVSVNSGIWQKIVSFFKNLFKVNRTIIQNIFR